MQSAAEHPKMLLTSSIIYSPCNGLPQPLGSYIFYLLDKQNDSHLCVRWLSDSEFQMEVFEAFTHNHKLALCRQTLANTSTDINQVHELCELK